MVAGRGKGDGAGELLELCELVLSIECKDPLDLFRERRFNAMLFDCRFLEGEVIVLFCELLDRLRR